MRLARVVLSFMGLLAGCGAEVGAKVPVGMNGLCPATGPFGAKEGEVLADATFETCEGAPRTVATLCENKASWLYTFTGW